MRDDMQPRGPRQLAEAHLVALADLAPWHDQLRGLLSPDELAKADRYIPSDKKLESVRCRGFLRALLGQRLGRDPRSLVFASISNGKPVLDPPTPLHFNLSHAGGWCLLGLGTQPLGVDIQEHDPRCDCGRLASRYLHPLELAQFTAAADQRLAFFRVWTRKEAVMKADGRGLSLDLTSFAVDLEAPRAALRAWQDPFLSALLISDLDVDSGLSAAWAAAGMAPGLEQWTVEQLTGLFDRPVTS